jgi:hypothetical protein
MMWARSSNALHKHKRAFGMTWVHSKYGRCAADLHQQYRSLVDQVVGGHQMADGRRVGAAQLECRLDWLLGTCVGVATAHLE